MNTLSNCIVWIHNQSPMVVVVAVACECWAPACLPEPDGETARRPDQGIETETAVSLWGGARPAGAWAVRLWPVEGREQNGGQGRTGHSRSTSTTQATQTVAGRAGVMPLWPHSSHGRPLICRGAERDTLPRRAPHAPARRSASDRSAASAVLGSSLYRRSTGVFRLPTRCTSSALASLYVRQLLACDRSRPGPFHGAPTQCRQAARSRHRRAAGGLPRLLQCGAPEAPVKLNRAACIPLKILNDRTTCMWERSVLVLAI